MSILRLAVIGVLLAAWTIAPAAAGELRLEFADGFVTLSAKEVPARDILQEWARKGQTRIVNADKVPGTPVTLELARVPERQALEVVLRSASGYMAAMRAAGPGQSSFDRIVVMPASAAPPRAAAPPPRAVQPQPPPPMVDQDADAPPFVPDEDDTVPPQMPGMPPGGEGENGPPMPPNAPPPFTPGTFNQGAAPDQAPAPADAAPPGPPVRGGDAPRTGTMCRPRREAAFGASHARRLPASGPRDRSAQPGASRRIRAAG